MGVETLCAWYTCDWFVSKETGKWHNIDWYGTKERFFHFIMVCLFSLLFKGSIKVLTILWEREWEWWSKVLESLREDSLYITKIFSISWIPSKGYYKLEFMTYIQTHTMQENKHYNYSKLKITLKMRYGIFPIKKLGLEIFLVVQWLSLCLPMQRVQIQSLVGELRSHMPHGQNTKNIKQKQNCDKFNEDFKNGLHPKQLKKKERNRAYICLPWMWMDFFNEQNMEKRTYALLWIWL